MATVIHLRPRLGGDLQHPTGVMVPSTIGGSNEPCEDARTRARRCLVSESKAFEGLLSVAFEANKKKTASSKNCVEHWVPLSWTMMDGIILKLIN